MKQNSFTENLWAWFSRTESEEQKRNREAAMWALFYGINWKQDIKDAAYAWYKQTFPETYKKRDEAKFYRDMARVPNDKCSYISQAIKTDFGKQRIARAMVATIRENLNYYK